MLEKFKTVAISLALVSMVSFVSLLPLSSLIQSVSLIVLLAATALLFCFELNFLAERIKKKKHVAVISFLCGVCFLLTAATFALSAAFFPFISISFLGLIVTALLLMSRMAKIFACFFELLSLKKIALKSAEISSIASKGMVSLLRSIVTPWSKEKIDPDNDDSHGLDTDKDKLYKLNESRIGAFLLVAFLAFFLFRIFVPSSALESAATFLSGNVLYTTGLYLLSIAVVFPFVIFLLPKKLFSKSDHPSDSSRLSSSLLRGDSDSTNSPIVENSSPTPAIPETPIGAQGELPNDDDDVVITL